MSCHWAREKLAGYVQDQLRPGETSAVRRHLLSCEVCYEEYEYQARLSSPLRELAAAPPPPAMATAIRWQAFAPPRPGFWERWQVHLSNLMRPVALPAAGGLLSALILFGFLMPAVSASRAAHLGQDVPTMLFTGPRFKEASPFPVTEDLLVEAWIDAQGKITDYRVLNGSHNGAMEQILRHESGNVLLTTVFEPATRFGQPTAGKVRLLLSRINIRG